MPHKLRTAPKAAILKNIVVFLADVPRDLQNERERVRRYLNQLGCEVLPQSWQASNSVEYAIALRKQLEKTNLFVQLLGSQLDTEPGRLEHSVTWTQYRAALDTGCPIMQWRPRDLDIEKIASKPYREMLLGSHVQSIALPEFHRSIQERLLAFARDNEVSKPKAIDTSIPLIFVNVDSTDLQLAQPLCSYLADQGLALALPLPDGRAEDTLRDLEANLIECDALLIAYSASPIQWAREQLRIYRRVMQRRQKPLKAFAVLEGPNKTRQALGMMMPNMDVIDCHGGFDTAQLESFLKKLNLSRETSSLS